MPLLERARELDRATRLIEATRDGRGAVLAVVGPAGIGKSFKL